MPLIDPHFRAITYLRLSVTDRCDLRCVYCMAEHPAFLPKTQLLSPDELARVASVFVGLGVRRLRLTGGEPLVLKGFDGLIADLSRHLGNGLDELTLTTNATQLEGKAAMLAAHGVRRVNISLDSLDPERFSRLTRGGDLARVLAGIAAARDAGLSIRINAVALKGENEHELDDIIRFCGEGGHDLALIEVMPIGDMPPGTRPAQHLSLGTVKEDLSRRWTLVADTHRSAGPARYWQIGETGRRIGFITPLSHNFCEQCNRVRVTATGRLTLCLGQEDGTDLRAVMRAHPGDDAPLRQAIRDAIAIKPRGHDFVIGRQSDAVARTMNVTGG